MQFIPIYDIIIGDGYGYSISYRSVGSKGVCPWGKHLGYALLLPQKCAPALVRIVAESLISWQFYITRWSLRSGKTRPTQPPTRLPLRGIGILILRISLFRFRVLMTTSFHKVVASRIRGKKVSKPLLLTHCDIGSQGSRYADWKYKIIMLLSFISITAVFHKEDALRIKNKRASKQLSANLSQ